MNYFVRRHDQHQVLGDKRQYAVSHGLGREPHRRILRHRKGPGQNGEIDMFELVGIGHGRFVHRRLADARDQRCYVTGCRDVGKLEQTLVSLLRTRGFDQPSPDGGESRLELPVRILVTNAPVKLFWQRCR